MSSVHYLSDEALLATLVGREKARQLVARSDKNLMHVVCEAGVSYGDPQRMLPPDPLNAAVELVKRAYLSQMRERMALSKPDVVRDYLRMELRALEHEVFMVLFLDAHTRLIAAETLFRGTITQTVVHPREVLKRVLHHNANGVIVAHNHPSGNATASEADIRLTRTLKEALALIDVRVLDHLIVAGSTVSSMAESGLI